MELAPHGATACYTVFLRSTNLTKWRKSYSLLTLIMRCYENPWFFELSGGRYVKRMVSMYLLLK